MPADSAFHVEGVVWWDWIAQVSGSEELALILLLLVASGVTLSKSYLPLWMSVSPNMELR